MCTLRTRETLDAGKAPTHLSPAICGYLTNNEFFTISAIYVKLYIKKKKNLKICGPHYSTGCN